MSERITGGASLHLVEDPTKCPMVHHKGPWRTVDCGGKAGPDRDVIECATCGAQRNVACDFDEEFS